MRTLLGMMIILLINQIYAQESLQHQPRSLRLTECIAQALDNNPTLKISQEKLRAAEARSSEVMTALLPQMKLSGRVAALSNVPTYTIKLPPPINYSMTVFPSIPHIYSTRVSFQQPIFTGFKLKKSQEMASFNADAMREDLNKDRSDLILNVTTAYWNLFRAIQIEEVLHRSVSQVSEHLKDIQSFAKQGMATDADVMKAQVQLSDMKVKHIEARNSIRLAMMMLNSLIGNPLDREITTADTPATSGNIKNTLLSEELHKLEDLACDQRAEVRSMQYRVEMNNAGVTAAKSGWFPQLFLGANYDYARPNQRIIPPKDQWDGTWDVGITLQWNVWDWFAAEYQTAQAKATLRQSEAAKMQVTDAVRLDVAQQYFNAQSTAEKVDVASIGKQQAQESYRITSEKFKVGLASTTDLLDADVALMQANLTYTQSIVDYTLALVKLAKAVGE